MAQADDRIKQLKIQTGVVKRITKEKTMYEKEAQDLEVKIENMKKEGADEYVQKKQNEVLQESKSMIPDTVRRLKTACGKLSDLVKECEADLSEKEEFKTARTVLEAGQAATES